MIVAEYASGLIYHAANLEEVDFRKFIVDNLVALRVAQWIWHPEIHGRIRIHGMRTKKNRAGQPLWRIYVADCEKCKVFVFSTGDARVLLDWIPGTQFFEPMGWAGDIDAAVRAVKMAREQAAIPVASEPCAK